MNIVIIFLLILQFIQSPRPAVFTHYGVGDGLVGQHHGAYWHGNSCGLPDVVDMESYGVAAPRWVPYCAKVLVCYEDACVVATVVDRQADDIIDGQQHFDLWPAVAMKLGIMEVGIVNGYVATYNDQD